MLEKETIHCQLEALPLFHEKSTIHIKIRKLQNNKNDLRHDRCSESEIIHMAQALQLYNKKIVNC